MKLKIKSIFILFTLFLVFSCQKQFVGLFKKGVYSKNEGLVEIPFAIENGLIIIQVLIEGEPYRFLLDTGAPNVVSKDLADKLRLKKRRSIKTIDSQGNTSLLDYVKVPSLTLGTAEFLNTTSAVADLRQADAIACLNIDGLIGANLMRKAYWQIDYRNNIIRIASDIDNLNIPEGGYELPFSTEITGTPLIHLKIGQTDIKRLKMDTGSVGFLSIDYDYYNSLKTNEHILASRSSYGTSSVGLFGTSEKDTSQQVLLKDISMGNLILTNQIIDLKRSKSSLLGMSFLNNYLVTIDWKDNLIFLSPQKEFHNSFAESFGISLLKEDDKMVVSLITNGSVAHQSGIKVGDIVLRVNDVDVTHTTLDEYCKIIRLVRLKEVDNLQIIIERDDKKYEYFLTKTPVLSN